MIGLAAKKLKKYEGFVELNNYILLVQMWTKYDSFVELNNLKHHPNRTRRDYTILKSIVNASVQPTTIHA